MRDTPIFSLRKPAEVLILSVLISVLGNSSCSIAKFVDPERPLLMQTEIQLENPKDAPDAKGLKADLNAAIDIETTSKISAWWWYQLETDKEKGIKAWLRRTLGSEPIYYSEEPINRGALLLTDYLKDHGYFSSEVEVDTLRPKPEFVHARFEILTRGRAKIDSIQLPPDSLSLSGLIRDNQSGSMLKKGDYYNVAALNAERARIDRIASRQGYFEMAPSNIFYFVDSSARAGGVEVFMRLSEGDDSLSFAQYHIGSTYVFPNYTLGADTVGVAGDTMWFEDLAIIRPSEAELHSAAIARRIQLRQGDLYDRELYENTINQLLDLGVFKFVNYQFERRMSDSTPVLDQYIYLTQGESQDINIDLEATSQNAAQLGLGASLRYANRNLFNGAEDFDISLSAAFGPQPSLTDPTQSVLGQEYGFSTSIALPRFIGPYAEILEKRAFYSPRTLASIRDQLTNRPDFKLQNAGLRLGYKYRANAFVTHELYPLSLNYTSLVNASEEFNERVLGSPRLRESFADNAIVGLEYRYLYSDQVVSGARSFWYIDWGIRSSGNLASLVASAPEAGGPKELFGVDLSQFIKFYADGRRTYNYRNSSWANRLYLGAALPYGNSDYIPFIEQFFAGGPNSIRAFPLRGLGPGASLPPSLDSNNVNQSGDVRLELNTEYRFDIFSFLEGAAFVDAGNVWLYKDVSGELPEAEFAFSDFYKELAVGTGIGLRLNFDVIVLRLDVAVPIRKPCLQGSDAWELENINIFSAANRKENLRLHIAIGYPF